MHLHSAHPFCFCCQKSEKKKGKQMSILSNTLVLFKSSLLGLLRSSAPILWVANNWLSSTLTWAISDAILYLEWISSSPEKWLIPWGTDGEQLAKAKMKEINIYHYSFCKCRHCLFMQQALMPSIHFPGSCGIHKVIPDGHASHMCAASHTPQGPALFSCRQFWSAALGWLCPKQSCCCW